MAIRIKGPMMLGSVMPTKEEKKYALSQKKSLAFRKVMKTVVREWICTMRMLASRAWPGVLPLSPGFLGKLATRNRAQHGAQLFFRGIGLPRIRWLGWCWEFTFQA